ncbi:hypothetical protein [Methylocella sp.]|uniref:hypothetical protein n=1 Tax=Methylocella sp. TaxID=1978226 RepID=UPI0035B4312F
MEIPKEALRIELVSPSESGETDGVAPLDAGWVTARAEGGGVSLAFLALSGADDPACATDKFSAPSALRIGV